MEQPNFSTAQKICIMVITLVMVIGISFIIKRFEAKTDKQTSSLTSNRISSPQLPPIKISQTGKKLQPVKPLAGKELSKALQHVKIDLNTASTEQFESLSGIGPVTALKITRFRKDNGNFRAIEDITKVPGIGPKTFEKIKDMIFVDPGGDINSNSAASKNEKININYAAMEELISLPGIGEKTAAAILTYREETGGFKSIDEITRVKGIGDAKFKEISPLITVEKANTPGLKNPRLKDFYGLNINTATIQEIAMLPGFSKNQAEKIVRHRKINGPFKSTEKIVDIPGISYMTYFRIQKYITVE
ncbi:MAG: ComEA family DNA-binding protein [Candidatus Aureabacteria bacterium]|nr:ComEA family DNA-binding protein [Candidatus Auribacterota bacterium]